MSGDVLVWEHGEGVKESLVLEGYKGRRVVGMCSLIFLSRAAILGRAVSKSAKVVYC